MNPRSLRFRALIAVVLVVALPVAWIWAAPVFEGTADLRLRAGLRRAAEAATAEPGNPDELDRIAKRYRVRLRVLDPSGAITVDLDRSQPMRWLYPMQDPFYGPGGRPDLRAIDTELLPLAQRSEVADARGAGAATHCEVAQRELMLVCAVAQRRADGSIVHVQQGHARPVRSLYEERFQLATLSLGVLVVGGVLALWMGVRMVRPIERLRDQVVRRTADHSTEPIELDRSDELGELAEAFNQLLAALDARNQSNEAFAADLAHELKNPVAAVRAAADAMASDRPVVGERKERLQRVLADSSTRMEAMVSRFLELARAEAGLVASEREPVALLGLTEALTAPLRDDVRFGGVVFEVRGEALQVEAALERLETAVRNVLVNAGSFAGDGGTVVAEVERDGRWAVLRVRDSGPGIAPGDLEHIFDRYYTTRATGTGLGLAMARAIVQAHGGSLEAASEPGEGATFTMRLPLA